MERPPSTTATVRELTDCVQRLNQTKIVERLDTRGTQWKFNPPAAPHFSEAWERIVRCAKVALTAILRERALTDEILTTTLVQVENLINGRPLTHLSVDPNDPEPITPNHLLLGRSNPNIPPDVFKEGDMELKKAWRFAQTLADHFWRRWMREYVPSLTEVTLAAEPLGK